MTDPHQAIIDRALRYANYATELQLIASHPNKRSTRMTLLKVADDFERLALSAEMIAMTREKLENIGR